MKLSILIPVYNAAKSIEKCIDSICGQENHNFDIEIIACNDGSTDNSLEILQKLSIRHKEMKIFDNANQGVYKTRNFALEQSTGDYIWLIDADDFVISDSLALLSNILKKGSPEIINFGYSIEEISGKFSEILPPDTEDVVDGFTFLENSDGRLYLWNNVYNLNFLSENNLRFLAKSVSLEDSLFNIVAFSKAQEVVYLRSNLYRYCYNQNSISKKRSIEHLLKLGQSSINVHEATQKLRNNYALSTREYHILNKRLEHSVLGFFYSLLKEKYPSNYISFIFSEYKKRKILPLKEENSRFRIRIFQKIVNNQWIYYLISVGHKAINR